MSYYVAKLPKYPEKWRVVWRKYELDKETQEYKAKSRHIPEAEYGHLGISKEMSLAEVKSIIKKINLQDAREKREAKRNSIVTRLNQEQEIECIHLPAPLL